MLKYLQLNKIFFFIVLVLSFTVGASTDNVVQVEMIIFEQKIKSEENLLEYKTNFIEEETDKSNKNYQMATSVLEEKWQLKEEAKKIHNNKNYVLLFHKAWEQKVSNNKSVQLIANNDLWDIKSNISIKDMKNMYKINLDFKFLNKDDFYGINYTKTARVKLKETYYYDHPKFGILLKLTRV